MISICIPIYNFDVRPLVGELARQIELAGKACEIVCIDDASHDDFKNINGNFCIKHGQYIQLYENVGRAQIRNMFAGYAHNDYLLFLDCDSLIHHHNFVANYLNSISDHALVVCGGRVYPPEKPEQHFLLRWRYGLKREIKNARQRRKNSHKSFQTNNFMVHKEVLKQIPFDNSLTRYGHEDTLFGFMLKLCGIPVIHIENTVLNGEIETNEEFLTKTEAAVDNLVYIYALLQGNNDFVKNVSLLKWYFRLQKLRMVFLLKLLNYCCTGRLRKRLLRGKASMRTFDLYKLLLLHEKFRKMNKPEDKKS